MPDLFEIFSQVVWSYSWPVKAYDQGSQTLQVFKHHSKCLQGKVATQSPGSHRCRGAGAFLDFSRGFSRANSQKFREPNTTSCSSLSCRDTQGCVYDHFQFCVCKTRSGHAHTVLTVSAENGALQRLSSGSPNHQDSAAASDKAICAPAQKYHPGGCVAALSLFPPVKRAEGMSFRLGQGNVPI